MISKAILFEKLVKKYGKVLTENYIRYTIIENDIEKAEQILEKHYKEELEYNKNR